MSDLADKCDGDAGDAPDIDIPWRGLLTRVGLVTAIAGGFFWVMGIGGVVFWLTALISTMIISGGGHTYGGMRR